MATISFNPYVEAAIAWEVCASIHLEYAKGKDGLFKTRQQDFLRHAQECRDKAKAVTNPYPEDNGQETMFVIHGDGGEWGNGPVIAIAQTELVARVAAKGVAFYGSDGYVHKRYVVRDKNGVVWLDFTAGVNHDV